ncbi:MAG: divalent metal cation transporter [Pseudomonadota bacterium]
MVWRAGEKAVWRGMVRLGPAALVAAAFVGPGTVTTCFLAGASFGYALLWALVFSTFATIVLQEMAARLGVGGRMGLGQALLQSTDNTAIKVAVGLLLVVALGIGNAAYEGGNLAGGALGASALLEGLGMGQRGSVLVLIVAAGAVLALGQQRHIERAMIGLVLLMSLSFFGALIIGGVDLAALVGGLRPSLPSGSAILVTALVGTTIVPYNLFLHAAASRDGFEGAQGMRDARVDTIVSIGIGGLISCAILLVAAGSDADGGTPLLEALGPSLGPVGGLVLAAGLTAAGLTSAITAPLATGFVLSEILAGWTERKALVQRVAAFSVLALGAGAALAGIRPTTLIVLAQAANGLLLPVVAIYLLVVMNNRSVLGEYANGRLSNVLGAIVVLVATALGILALMRVLGISL